MKIAILSSMYSEILPLLKTMKYNKFKFMKKEYYLIKNTKHEIIITYTNVGKTFATAITTFIIEHFKVEIVIFIGLAGGINNILQIGELIVPHKTVQHDIDLTSFGRHKGLLPQSNIFYYTSNHLIKKLKNLSKKINTTFYQGIIATGDQFIHKIEDKINIANTFNADAIDMESASVNVVCHLFNIPCLIIKLISDNLYGNSIKNFKDFLNTAEYKYLNLLLHFINFL